MWESRVSNDTDKHTIRAQRLAYGKLELTELWYPACCIVLVSRPLTIDMFQAVIASTAQRLLASWGYIVESDPLSHRDRVT